MTEMIGKKLSHSQFGQKVAKILEDKGCWLFNVHGERMQKRFVPDLLVIGLRWKGFLEFKVRDDKCSDGQKEQIERIEKRNFPCYVLRYNRELDCIQIENREGEMLNLVAWQALWSWLKKPVELIIHDPPICFDRDPPICFDTSPVSENKSKIMVNGQEFDTMKEFLERNDAE